MKSDSPSFDKFNDYDEEFEIPEVPQLDDEYKNDSSYIMEPDESGIFAATFDISAFIDTLEHTFEFSISYEVNDKSRESKLIMNAGELLIDANKLYSTELDVINWTYDKYRNLLAITSTSKSYYLHIMFKEALHVSKGIENFLVKNLKFEILKVNEDRDNERPQSYIESLDNCICLKLCHDYFLYCSIGIFKGVLIRIKLENDIFMKAKVYVRECYQVIALVHAINQNYPNQCSIISPKVYKNAI